MRLNHIVHEAPIGYITYAIGGLASMGGFLFGWDTGQIADLLIMDDYRNRFAQHEVPGEPKEWNTWIRGLLVSLLSAGAVFGALIGAPISDKLGRRLSVTLGCILYMVGLIIQISSDHGWPQMAVGRIFDGIAIGWLSSAIPLYQSEIVPRQVRGAIVGTYQLFITLGILMSYCACYGTHSYGDSGQWRVPMGIGFAWGLLLGSCILLCPESPRWLGKRGQFDKTKHVLALMRGVDENDAYLNNEFEEIKQEVIKEAELEESGTWLDCFSFKQKALYRTFLGMYLQMGQQLTGANYFFYYGATIFRKVDLMDTETDNSYISQIILGAVNFVTTFPGLYALDKLGRRTCLMTGAAWMTIWLIVFATTGVADSNGDEIKHKSTSILMICSACFFILGFASTWGPGVWSSIAESAVPTLRARQMALATMSNWIWNFNLAFFTSPITDDIHYAYGYVFVGCCAASFLVVYFFVYETANLDLEAIQDMFGDRSVKPWNSHKWVPAGCTSRNDVKHDIEQTKPENDELLSADQNELHTGDEVPIETGEPA